MPRSSISIDPRLLALSELCGDCRVLADVGCDHGRLGAYMLQTGKCARVLFADISGASLDKARRLVSILGLEGRAYFCVGDGAGALTEAPDVCVIAGMGGETITGIVDRGLPLLKNARLVLQPNVAAKELRESLAHLGFRISDERMVRDGRRLYPVIVAEAGKASYDEMQLIVGPVLMARRSPELYDYAKFKIRVATKAFSGIARGGADGAAMERELRIWEEVAGWYG